MRQPPDAVERRLFVANPRMPHAEEERHDEHHDGHRNPAIDRSVNSIATPTVAIDTQDDRRPSSE